MSSEKYEIAQDELEAIFDRVEAAIQGTLAKQKCAAEERRVLVSRTRSQLDEGRCLLEEMDQEARIAPLQYRGDMMSRVRECRQRSAELGRRLRDRTEAAAAIQPPSSVAAAPVAGAGVGGLEPTAAAAAPTHDELHRTQVLQGRRVLESTSYSIYRSEQVAAETEAVGEGIIEDLGVQRETLERAATRIRETHVEISRSRKILKRMYLGVLKNKVVLICIIIVELAIIAAIVYYKFFSK